MYEYKNECSNKDQNDFVIIDWSASKIFTLFENFKRVKLGDLVTCIVNNNKDIGTVVFTGFCYYIYWLNLKNLFQSI